jgi:hypothetical protein
VTAPPRRRHRARVPRTKPGVPPVVLVAVGVALVIWGALAVALLWVLP